jgi:hypothetical protein
VGPRAWVVGLSSRAVALWRAVAEHDSPAARQTSSEATPLCGLARGNFAQWVIDTLAPGPQTGRASEEGCSLRELRRGERVPATAAESRTSLFSVERRVGHWHATVDRQNDRLLLRNIGAQPAYSVVLVVCVDETTDVETSDEVDSGECVSFDACDWADAARLDWQRLSAQLSAVGAAYVTRPRIRIAYRVTWSSASGTRFTHGWQRMGWRVRLRSTR